MKIILKTQYVMAVMTEALDHQQITIPILIVNQLFFKRVLDNNKHNLRFAFICRT